MLSSDMRTRQMYTTACPPLPVLHCLFSTPTQFWDRGRPSAWIHYLRGHTRPVSAVRFSYGTTGLCANGSGPGSKVRYGSIGPWARQQQLPWRRLGMVAGGSCAALLLLGLSRRHAAACGCGACCWLPGHAGGVYTAEGACARAGFVRTSCALYI